MLKTLIVLKRLQVCKKPHVLWWFTEIIVEDIKGIKATRHLTLPLTNAREEQILSKITLRKRHITPIIINR